MRPPVCAARHSQLRGFSLVEVALALAVVAVAFVAVLGLLPAGLAQFRGAMDTTIGAQIFQRVVGDVQQTDFDTLLASAVDRGEGHYALPTRYFDEQGNEVLAAKGEELTAEQRTRVLYQVRVRGADPGAADAAQHRAENLTSLPSSDSERFNPRDSTFLTVQVARNPAGRAIPTDARLLWDAPAASRMGVAMRAYPAIVTRNGYPPPTDSPP